MLALEGKQLGNYDVIRRIRVGGMGAVYEGRQRTAFGRRVAIKVILGNYAADREMRRRFAQEARTVAQLQHPHILPLIEFGDEQGILYLVMPFIDGGTLTSYLRRSLPDLNEVAAIYLQLLEAVEYAHEAGLIHRDIKSSNVLLDLRRSGPPYVYLADFGLVLTSQQAELEQDGKTIPLDQVPGTPHYMAPEQTRGIVSASTDIYALGVLLYQILTGELPYDDPDEVQVIQMHLYAPIPSLCDTDASIPVELGEVVRVAMAKEAADRFGSVADLRKAFLAAIDGPIATVDDDELPLDAEISSPDRPVLTPLRLPEPPAPVVVPRRSQRAAAPLLVSERRPIKGAATVRRPITRSVAGAGKQRFKKPVVDRRKRFTLSLVAALVPTTLLILLLMPRVLGVSFFPSGFPIFGTAPLAIVSVTAQSKMLQDTYLLTASPQATAPDLTTRVIPDRTLHATSIDSRSTQTTGTRSVAGVQASGTLRFVNSTNTPISVPALITFTTNSGVQVETTQTVDVPARQDGQNGRVFAPAVAVNPGVTGNIPAHELAMSCCNGLLVSNPQAFTGGVDARVVHLLTQADLDGLRSALSSELRQRVLQQLQKQLNTGDVMAGQPTYNVEVSTDNPVGAQADQVQMLMNVLGTVTVYNSDVARHIAAQSLVEQATQTLDNNYQLQGTPSVATPQVVQQDASGLVHLSVAVSGLWVYYISPQQKDHWRQAIKGATSTLAIAYLNAQAGVAAVQIQLPFGTDHLPSSVDQIQIVLVEK